jgi:hypothetical protein
VKRFAVVQDREFEIGGEVFEWVYPYWEDIAEVFDKDASEDEDGNVADITVRDTIGDFIQRIQLFLEADQRERWVALTKRKKNPIPHAQYAELYRWLLEITSLPTPTEPSSPSEDGQQPTAVTSAGA